MSRRMANYFEAVVRSFLVRCFLRERIRADGEELVVESVLF